MRYSPANPRLLRPADWQNLADYGFPAGDLRDLGPISSSLNGDGADPTPTVSAIRLNPSTSRSGATKFKDLAASLGRAFNSPIPEIHKAKGIFLEIGASPDSALSRRSKLYPEIVVFSVTEQLAAISDIIQNLITKAAKEFAYVHIWVSMPCAGGAASQTVNEARYPRWFPINESWRGLTLGVARFVYNLCKAHSHVQFSIELPLNNRMWGGF